MRSQVVTKKEGFAECSPEEAPTVLLIAGESSADIHGANVVRELKRMLPNVSVYGMGGTQLRKAGMETIVDSETSASVMGFTEVLGSLKKIVKAFTALVRSVEERKPKLAILIDYAEFNMLMAKRLKKRGVKVLYFISPQLWAWRRGRVKKIKRYVDKVASIFPFEEDFYKDYAIDSEYVGHPFIDRPGSESTRELFFSQYGIDPKRPVVAFLPGSRKSEIQTLLCPMVKAFTLLNAGKPGIQGVVPVADTVDIARLSQSLGERKDFHLIPGNAHVLLQHADVAVVASGTATVEAALAKLPFFIVYKLSRLSYLISTFLVRRIKYFGMPNLIAGTKIVDEFLQGEVTPERISQEVDSLLYDAQKRERIVKGLEGIEKKLHETKKTPLKVSERVAHIVIEMLEA